MIHDFVYTVSRLWFQLSTSCLLVSLVVCVSSCFCLLQSAKNAFSSPSSFWHVEFDDTYAISVLPKLLLPLLQCHLHSLYYVLARLSACNLFEREAKGKKLKLVIVLERLCISLVPETIYVLFSYTPEAVSVIFYSFGALSH